MLFNDQRLAIKKMSKLKAGALFMEMGTGKTRAAIEIARSKKDCFDAIIWCAPASLINDSGYISEINLWYDGFSGDIKYFTTEGISQSDRSFLKLISFAQNNRVFIVIDESLDIKNPIAKRTKRLLNYWHVFDFRLILNGTPLSKGLIDIWAQIQFIHPKILNMTEAQFANNFLVYEKNGYRSWTRWSRPENEQALIEMIRPYIFDADLDIDCEYENKTIDVKLTSDEVSDYQKKKNEYLSGKFDVQFLPMAQKFQSIYSCCKSKIEWLKSNTKEGKWLIFVKFHKSIDIIKSEICANEYSGRVKEGFSDIRIMTYGTGSRGLNLQKYNNIVFFDQTFDWSHKEHAVKRCYRRGQNKKVTVYDIFLDTGLDNMMRSSLEKKTGTSENIKKIISAKEAMEL